MGNVLVKGLVLMVAVTSLSTVRHALRAPLRVLHIGHNVVHLPLRERPAGWFAIERSAIGATGGGQIESIRPGLWVGKPVWMCTVSQGRTVWHVMVNQVTLQPISKILASHH